MQIVWASVTGLISLKRTLLNDFKSFFSEYYNKISEMITANVYVAVQFYPWLNFISLCFWLTNEN